MRGIISEVKTDRTRYGAQTRRACADGLTDMTGFFLMLLLTAYNLLFLLPFLPVNTYSK